MRTLIERMKDASEDPDPDNNLDDKEADKDVFIGQKSQAELDNDAKEIIAKKNKFYGKEVMDKFK